MTRFRIAFRILAALLALVVVIAVAVPIRQRLFRRRAERLLADMQSIELHKTDWSNAQELMHRWGAWGRYEGTCTWANCKYTVLLSDWSGYRTDFDERGWLRRAAWPFFTSPLYRVLGGRIGAFYVGFTVQDGTIWRTYQAIYLDVPDNSGVRNYETEYVNIVHVQSRSSLNPNSAPGISHWILGGNSQLAEHPYFKAGRPGGCANCMALDITYSTTAPRNQIHQLTSFDLSCITRWKPCLFPEDILPAARPWHIYYREDRRLAELPEPPRPCEVPVWVLGRDAISVLSVDVLSSATGKGRYAESLDEFAKVRLMEILKGKTPWSKSVSLLVNPYPGDQINPPLDPPEHLKPGNRYLLLVNYHLDDDDKNHPAPPELIDGLPGIRLERCGVLDDTTQNRAELFRGFDQNDALRMPEF